METTAGDGPREEVRRLLAADRAGGGLQPLAHYQNLFPGRWDVVAAEYRAASVAPAFATRPGTAAVGAAAAGVPPGAPRIGPYLIVGELGRGGMGVVHEARDTRLPRRVALKVLAPQYASSDALRLRFEREAALASRLDHPNICTVYEAGESDGTAWIAMRFLEGTVLSDLIAGSRGPGDGSGAVSLVTAGAGAPPAPGAVASRATSADLRAATDRVLLLFEKAARGLHHAHEKGLVHRDVKPHNIMVTPEGEPVLLDFGLAREEAGEGHQLTRTGHLMGTPSYMSPEQLTAQRITLDRRTDVYSLGVSLYEALTLRLPFDAPTVEGLYQRILGTDPEDPRRLNPSLPADLKVVLETALEKDRDRRYQTALAMAEDIARVRMREPIRARPVGAGVRLRRWMQRNPATAAAAASLFLALSAGLGASLHLLGEARTERDAKETALKEVEAARRLAVSARTGAEEALRRARALGLASASLEAGESDPVVALHLAVEAARAEPLPAVNIRLHGALAASRERAFLVHGAPVVGVRWSPTGERILTGSEDGKARLFDAGGGAVAVLEGHTGPLTAALFSAAGDRILTSSGDGTARLWDAAGKPLAVLRAGGGAVTCAAAIPGGGWITGNADGTTRLWSMAGEEGTVLRGHEGAVLAVDVSANGRVIATGGEDGTARLWDADGSPRGSLSNQGPVEVLRFSPAGDRVILASSARVALHGAASTPRDEEARVMNLDGRVLFTLREAVNTYSAAAWSPSGHLIATLNDEGSFALWKGDGSLVRELSVHHHSRGGVAFSPDGSLVLAGVADDGVHLWTREGEEVAVLRGHSGTILEARFSPDGNSVATASMDGTARVWAVDRGEIAATVPFARGDLVRFSVTATGDRVALARFRGREVRVLDGAGRPVAEARGIGFDIVGVEFAAGGRSFAVKGIDGELQIRDAETASLRISLDAHPGGRRRVLLGPTGDRMALMEPDRSIRFLGLDGTPLPSPEGVLPAAPSGATWSPDGRTFAVALPEEVRSWSSDGVPLAALPVKERLSGLRFSPDGNRFLAVTGRGAVVIKRSGSPPLVFDGHQGPVTGAEFSPDGARLVTWGMDLTARVFNEDGTLQAVLRGHGGEVSETMFLPDGKRLLTVAAGDAIRLWSEEGRLLDELRPKEGGLYDFQASADIRRLFATDTDGVLRVFTLDPGELVRLAEGRITRPLTEENLARWGELIRR